MKFGIRKPSLKKSVKARTTGKAKRRLKKAVNPLYGKKGMGFARNPKRAVRSAVYRKVTIGLPDLKPKRARKAPANGGTTAMAREGEGKPSGRDNDGAGAPTKTGKGRRKVAIGLAAMLGLAALGQNGKANQAYYEMPYRSESAGKTASNADVETAKGADPQQGESIEAQQDAITAAAQQEAELQAQEEAERQAQEAAERQAQEAAERASQEEAERQTQEAARSRTVYVTRTGTHYHFDRYCRGLNRAKEIFESTLDSTAGLEPCSICAR